MPLRNIDDILRSRQAAMKVKPDDANSATHLLRCALGGTAYGVDHGRLSQVILKSSSLSLPFINQPFKFLTNFDANSDYSDFADAYATAGHGPLL